MKKKKDEPSRFNRFPIIADANGLWEDIDSDEIPSDVLGSYTGNPSETDYPIQDADDL